MNIVDVVTPATPFDNDIKILNEDFTFIDIPTPIPPTMGEWLNTAEPIHRNSREELNVVDI